MNILSLFGGIECWRVALDRFWIPVDKYFSSEIDPYAIKVTQANYPDIFHIGSVTDVSYKDWVLKSQNISAFDRIDLLIGGSPCQDLSIAKAWGKGLDGEKSGLFFEFVRILDEVKPKYFLLENVASMKKADRDKISEVLGIEPILINSSLVSAQNRKRLYWTNIPWVTQPEDKWILLRDILEDIPTTNESWRKLEDKYLKDEIRVKFDKKRDEILGIYQKPRGKNNGGLVQNGDKSPTINASRFQDNNFVLWQFRRTNLRIHSDQEKCCTLTSNMGTGGNNVPVLINTEYYWRKLTPIECERLQTLPDGYTAHVSDSRRYKAIGNGWTVDVIAHILSFMK